ncbi:hypothetical protein ACFZAG_27705 [Streptomyces sp. NPDC012403]|uniref:hypothetical protein n=1 Tax=Streptomyces sp. NPDC012403 TaxID=3364831 RepID=UPI0036EB6694
MPKPDGSRGNTADGEPGDGGAVQQRPVPAARAQSGTTDAGSGRPTVVLRPSTTPYAPRPASSDTPVTIDGSSPRSRAASTMEWARDVRRVLVHRGRQPQHLGGFPAGGRGHVDHARAAVGA